MADRRCLPLRGRLRRRRPPESVLLPPFHLHHCTPCAAMQLPGPESYHPTRIRVGIGVGMTGDPAKWRSPGSNRCTSSSYTRRLFLSSARICTRSDSSCSSKGWRWLGTRRKDYSRAGRQWEFWLWVWQWALGSEHRWALGWAPCVGSYVRGRRGGALVGAADGTLVGGAVVVTPAALVHPTAHATVGPGVGTFVGTLVGASVLLRLRRRRRRKAGADVGALGGKGV